MSQRGLLWATIYELPCNLSLLMAGCQPTCSSTPFLLHNVHFRPNESLMTCIMNRQLHSLSDFHGMAARYLIGYS